MAVLALNRTQITLRTCSTNSRFSSLLLRLTSVVCSALVLLKSMTTLRTLVLVGLHAQWAYKARIFKLSVLPRVVEALHQPHLLLDALPLLRVCHACAVVRLDGNGLARQLVVGTAHLCVHTGAQCTQQCTVSE